ncbi:MAG: hypothetical protein ACI9HA_001035 [Dinoroseobacter sp.]|jgi:hypothetical protein
MLVPGWRGALEVLFKNRLESGANDFTIASPEDLDHVPVAVADSTVAINPNDAFFTFVAHFCLKFANGHDIMTDSI